MDPQITLKIKTLKAQIARLNAEAVEAEADKRRENEFQTRIRVQRKKERQEAKGLKPIRRSDDSTYQP